MPLFIKFGEPCGSSSVGRARPSQGRCRGFEPLFPLEKQKTPFGVFSFFNKSFPRCVSSLENRITSFDCSLGKHTSRSKNKRWLWHTSAFSGKNIYYRSEQLQQAETLVTVSPCEFPPRCHLPVTPGSSRGHTKHPSFPAFHSPFIWHFRKFYIDYRQTNLLKKV